MEERFLKLERNYRVLRRYAAAMTLGFAVLSVAAFRQAGRTRFTEIDVERLNVVEKNGTLRLAIHNSLRAPGTTFYGKEYRGARGGNAIGGAGMLYFNDEGTEQGGFSWSGRKLADGTYRANGHITFDQYNQDETLAIAYTDANGARTAGLMVWDEPDVSLEPVIESLSVIRQLPGSVERDRRLRALRAWRTATGQVRASRLFVGKDRSKAAIVALSDPKGRPRLRLSVDSLGVPRLEFLDDSGKVVDRLPKAGQ